MRSPYLLPLALATLLASTTLSLQAQTLPQRILPNPVVTCDGRIIDLSSDELARIGVRVAEDGYVEYYQIYFHGNLRSYTTVPSTDPSVGRVLRGYISHQVDIERVPLPQEAGLAYPAIAPRFVTDSRGVRRYMAHYWGSGNRRDSATEAISRHIDSIESFQARNPQYLHRLFRVRAHQRDGEEVILWHYPRPDLLAALPRRVLQGLRNDYASLLGRSVSGDSTVNSTWTLSTIVTIDSLLGFPRSHVDLSGGQSDVGVAGEQEGSTLHGTTISLSVTPNPAHGDVIVRYHTEAARHVRAILYDVHGRGVRELFSSEAGAGDSEQHVSLEGLPSGSYLVALETSMEERVVQKLVVE